MDKGYDGITKDYPDTSLFLPHKKINHKARRAHPLSEEQKAYNRHLSRYRIIVEHSLAQANQFQSLAQVYRQGHEQHPQVMRVVAGLVNRRLDKQPLKSYANSSTQSSTVSRAVCMPA